MSLTLCQDTRKIIGDFPRSKGLPEVAKHAIIAHVAVIDLRLVGSAAGLAASGPRESSAAHTGIKARLLSAATTVRGSKGSTA